MYRKIWIFLLCTVQIFSLQGCSHASFYNRKYCEPSVVQMNAVADLKGCFPRYDIFLRTSEMYAALAVRKKGFVECYASMSPVKLCHSHVFEILYHQLTAVQQKLFWESVKRGQFVLQREQASFVF